jgi:hypothetical protein
MNLSSISVKKVPFRISEHKVRNSAYAYSYDVNRIMQSVDFRAVFFMSLF